MQKPPNISAQARLRRIIAELQAVASQLPTVAARTFNWFLSPDDDARLAPTDIASIQNIRRRCAHSSGSNHSVSARSVRCRFTPVGPL